LNCSAVVRFRTLPALFLVSGAPLAFAGAGADPWAAQESVGLLQGGGEIPSTPSPGQTCVSEAQRLEVERLVEAWLARPDRPTLPAEAAQLYAFYPIGGRLDRDVWPSQYFDDDPGVGGVLDWDCGTRTYDHHNGTDTALRSFGEQDVGVPIYAVLDGIVIGTQDGQPDKNTSCSPPGPPANYVVLDNGMGRITRYWHMKTGSVSVSAGETVLAGQQIGLVGSSGCSTGPHLHFGCTQNGVAFDPFTGPCNPGPSSWINQIPIHHSLYMNDFGLSETSPQGITPPDPLPTSSQWAQTNAQIYMWCKLKNLPAGSTHQWRLKRPDGTIQYTNPVTSFNNATSFASSWWWWGITSPAMQSIPGTWEIQLKINGQVMIDAPVEVVPTSNPGFNRPPEPITVAFDPACPVPSDVLRCEIDTDLLLDDLDWDIVSYHYVWRVNGSVVRDVTTAGHKDVLPRNSWLAGDDVTCEVTPNDGTVDGATVVASLSSAVSYCTAGVSASGCQATLSAAGMASATAPSGFHLSAFDVEGQKDGLFFYAANGRQANSWGNGTSFQCVVPPVRRGGLLAGSGTSGSCDGSFSQDLNARWTAKPSHNPGAGAIVQAQLWYRDPFNTSNQTTSLSNAIEFTMCP